MRRIRFLHTSKNQQEIQYNGNKNGKFKIQTMGYTTGQMIYIFQPINGIKKMERGAVID